MKLGIAIFALCLALAAASQVSPAGSARDIYNYKSDISPPKITENKGGGGGGGGHGGDDGDGESSSGSGSSGHSGGSGGGSDANTLRNSNTLLSLILLLFGTIGI